NYKNINFLKIIIKISSFKSENVKIYSTLFPRISIPYNLFTPISNPKISIAPTIKEIFTNIPIFHYKRAKILENAY
ncbi:LOW QUALITY PROTEIN: hypothetical protein PanWU01x14_071120, partial [Parasponia andersonii]